MPSRQFPSYGQKTPELIQIQLFLFIRNYIQIKLYTRAHNERRKKPNISISLKYFLLKFSKKLAANLPTN